MDNPGVQKHETREERWMGETKEAIQVCVYCTAENPVDATECSQCKRPLLENYALPRGPSGSLDLGRLIESNPQVYALLRETVARDVAQSLAARKSREQTVFLGLVSVVIVGVIAIGGFLVNELLGVRVAAAIEKERGRGLDQAVYMAEVAELSYQANLLKAEGGYDDEEATIIIERIRSLYARGVEGRADDPVEQLANQMRLVYSVETAITAFFGARRGDLVDATAAAAPGIVKTSQKILQIMVQYRGRELLGLPGAPGTWFDREGTPIAEYERFDEFAERALAGNYPELYIVFELLIRHLEKRPQSELRELCDDADSLNERDKRAFVLLMVALANGNFTIAPNANSGRIVTRTKAFLRDYGSYSQVLKVVCEQVAIEPKPLESPR